MALIRWEPTREVQSLQRDLNRLFGSVFDSQTSGDAAVASRRWSPAMDLLEGESVYTLRADLPGLGEEDVSIEVDDRVLTISGERASSREDRKDGFYRIERASGRFSRSLTLPEGVDAEAIEADFENGVLEVTIPKPQERKPTRVAIKPGARQSAVESAPSEPQAA